MRIFRCLTVSILLPSHLIVLNDWTSARLLVSLPACLQAAVSASALLCVHLCRCSGVSVRLCI
ncbi:hypothetical protein B484DRAFT_446652, partial [Ochromonadaceae sp. CCMP2298]